MRYVVGSRDPVRQTNLPCKVQNITRVNIGDFHMMYLCSEPVGLDVQLES